MNCSIDESLKITPTASFRFLRLREVCEITGLSRSQIYRMQGTSDFPPRVKLSQSISAWVSTEIAVWQAERIALSRKGAL